MKIVDGIVFVKSCTYRIFASLVTFSISYLLTGNLKLSSAIGVCEFVGKIFCFYFFEIFWKFFYEKLTSKSYRKNCYKFDKHGACIWLSGLNCTGKTSVGRQLVKAIPNSVLLDGDAIRQSLNKDLGFSPEDISTNIRRIADVAKILTDQGFTVVVTCISKNRKDRTAAKKTIGNKFIECHITASDDELERRISVLHKNTPVIQKNYEISDDMIELDTTGKTAEESTRELLCKLKG